MAFRFKEKKVFFRKPVQAFIYKWSPNDEEFEKKGPECGKPLVRKCLAFAGTNNPDNNVTYVHGVGNIAYVECNYVE